MTVRLKESLGVYPAGTVMDVNEFWGDVLCLSGLAEPVLTEPIITLNGDGSRVLDLRISDSLALEDH